MLSCIDPFRQINVAAVPEAREHDDADRVTIARVRLGEEEYVVSPNSNLKMEGNLKFKIDQSINK